MIRYIEKRDGRIEPYIPSKINTWGKWAAKDIGRGVDWSHIVLKTVSGLPETVKSSELQNKLIQNCLNEETWSYYLMAGRLYATQIYKEVFPQGKIPHIKDLHEELFNNGLMEQLSYTDQEYDKINDMLNHHADFNTPHFSLHYIRNKYSLRNRVTGKEYESQQFTYMRMAMALSQNESKENRLDLVERFYKVFSNKRLSAPTPNYVNLGTELKGFASCNLYVADDTIDSLAAGDHIAYMMTAASAGLGGFINSRSLGDPVRAGVISHQGKNLPL